MGGSAPGEASLQGQDKPEVLRDFRRAERANQDHLQAEQAETLYPDPVEAAGSQRQLCLAEA